MDSFQIEGRPQRVDSGKAVTDGELLADAGQARVDGGFARMVRGDGVECVAFKVGLPVARAGA